MRSPPYPPSLHTYVCITRHQIILANHGKLLFREILQNYTSISFSYCNSVLFKLVCCSVCNSLHCPRFHKIKIYGFVPLSDTFFHCIREIYDYSARRLMWPPRDQALAGGHIIRHWPYFKYKYFKYKSCIF